MQAPRATRRRPGCDKLQGEPGPWKAAMGLTSGERAQREAFDLEYRQALRPALQAIERAVCGCGIPVTVTIIESLDLSSVH